VNLTTDFHILRKWGFWSSLLHLGVVLKHRANFTSAASKTRPRQTPILQCVSFNTFRTAIFLLLYVFPCCTVRKLGSWDRVPFRACIFVCVLLCFPVQIKALRWANPHLRSRFECLTYTVY
jgi:hypothetical protein